MRQLDANVVGAPGATSLLEMPEDLRARVGQKYYTIWSETTKDQPTSVRQQAKEQSQSLNVELTMLRAKEVLHADSFAATASGEGGFIFVHIATLSTTLLHFPAIATIRAIRPEICLYSFGTFEGVPDKYWGFQELNPMGTLYTRC
jgi:hypothetical protein